MGFTSDQLAALLTIPTPKIVPIRMCVDDTGRPSGKHELARNRCFRVDFSSAQHIQDCGEGVRDVISSNIEGHKQDKSNRHGQHRVVGRLPNIACSPQPKRHHSDRKQRTKR